MALNTDLSVRLIVDESGLDPDSKFGFEPVTCGVPWPKGVLLDESNIVLQDDQGQVVSVQCKALDRWADNSVRWCLLDFLVDRSRAKELTVRVLETREARNIVTAQAAWVRQSAEKIEIDAGGVVFSVARGTEFPFSRAETELGDLMSADKTRCCLVGDDGQEYGLLIEELEVLDLGEVRTCIGVTGHFVAKNRAHRALASGRIHFFRELSTVRVELTIQNPCAAKHPQGVWSLGDSGSLFLKEFSVSVGLKQSASEAVVLWSPKLGTHFRRQAPPLEIYQASSGGKNWDSRVHVDHQGNVPLSFDGYTIETGDLRETGCRATPVVAVDDGLGRVSLAMQYFWQEFPKSVTVDRGTLEIGLLPRQAGYLHELQGGEQKTHVFHLSFEPMASGDPLLGWVREPVLAHPEPSWYAESGGISGLFSAAPSLDSRYSTLVEEALEGPLSLESKRETADEYGWRNFGDHWADHEALFSRHPREFVSHYNNQYDLIRGLGIQFMLSGDPRWFRYMDELARHVTDIDLYHTDQDKWAYNHGFFWHTFHHVEAGTSSHRTYPHDDHSPGGGPSPSHLYTSGLLLHHYMTGNRSSAEAVASLGGFVLDSDDGRKTILRFLDRGNTGLISESAPGYHGPGRGPANSLNALLDAHRVTGESKFVIKAESLIRRCIHPLDDLKARDLENVEYRWFYTMFLQALGTYLERKIELGELDGSYAYARASLLHYARWALQYESPYLERPELLEFPTETWHAQDLRKGRLFIYAARHADKTERYLFLEKGRSFFENSMDRLSGCPTRHYTRPLAILFSDGHSQEWCDGRDLVTAPPPATTEDSWKEPQLFESQRSRAVRTLKNGGLVFVLLIFAILALLMYV